MNSSYIGIFVLFSALAAAGGMISIAYAQTVTQTEVPDSFADVQVVQDANQIVVTITKEGAPVEPGPIIVDNENGTITEPSTDNVTIIEPAGNITEVPDANVTIIDNTTVVVAPENETVSETPGGAVVIDAPCGCPPSGNETVAEPEPVPPAAGGGDNVTAPAPEPGGTELNGNNTTVPVDESSDDKAPALTSFLAGLFQQGQ